MAYNQAMPFLTRRGYLLDGHIFSGAFKAYILRHMPRIQLSVDSGAVHIEQRPVDLPPKEFSLLGPSSTARATSSPRTRSPRPSGPSTARTPSGSPTR